MRRPLPLLFALALIAGGSLVALYGLFAILYEGDSPGADPVVKVGDRDVDADVVGAVTLTLGLGGVLLGALLMRRRSRP
jgi:hypothetical protein